MSLNILKASAGSGKTYALTLHYLKLILSVNDPAYFKKILAVTFTNKATREMKERILSELGKAASGELDKGMGLDLKNQLQISEEILEQRAKEALSTILHNYSHFSVSTNDSFFQKVIRNFAREEGLPANYKVELNTNKVIQDLIDALLDKAESDAALKAWLVRLSSFKMEDGKSWDIRYELEKLLKEIFKEDFIPPANQNNQVLNVPSQVIQLHDQLLTKKRDFEDKMNAISQEAWSFIHQEGLTIDDFIYNNGGPANHFNKISYETKEYEPGKRVLSRITGQLNWYSQKTPQETKNRIDSISPILDDCLNNAVNLFNEEHKNYLEVCAIFKHLATFAILNYFIVLLQKYRDENNTLLISDISRLLNGIIADDEVPFIYEKTGNRYQHFLIDEFQDTSRQHWGNFKPLLTNSVSMEQPCLIVGDPKQSIYRWRGGDMQLMQHQVKQDISSFSENMLEHNWRSCPAIIDFNNDLFKSAAEIVYDALKPDNIEGLPQQEKAEIEQLISNVKEVYEEAHQAFPEVKEEQNTRRGYVLVQATQHSNELSFKCRAHFLLLQNLERIREQGYPLSDIALLLRTNAEARELAEFLSAQKYDVLSEDALLLKASSGVRLIVNTLRYLYNYKDHPALAAATHLYLKEVRKMEDSRLAQIDWKDFKSLKEHLPEAFTSKNIELGSMPLYELCSKLYQVFKLSQLKDEQHHLHAFLDQVHHFSHEEAGDLGGFLLWWEEEGIKKCLKREQAPDAIRLLTLHKSKGLQYPVVIIPYCNWDFKPKSGQILWTSTQDSLGNFKHLSLQPLGNTMIPISFSSDLENTAFKADYLKESSQSYLDNLNLLYVALTRAEEAMIITYQKPGNTATSFNISRMMHNYFNGEEFAQLKAQEEAKVDDIAFDYEYWEFGQLTPASQKKIKNEDEVSEVHKPIENWNQLLRLRRHARPLLLLENEAVAQKVDYGDRVHQVLEEVKYADELEAVLEKQQLRAELAADDAKLIRKKLSQLLQDASIAPWFSRDWPEVLNEQPIQDSEGNIFRPDRILLKDKQAIVIDYKTGKKSDRHRKQVQNYMRLLQELGYDEVQGYLLYLENETDFVEEVKL
ncbi:MAG: UvrD-helicase domain-containing protein [Cyclobacteriaceae bacterium]